jgi:hypothetical protein
MCRGQRLNSAEGVYLLTEAPLLGLGSLAQEQRAQRPTRYVTYVIDTNQPQRVHGGLPLLRVLPQAQRNASDAA